MENSGWHFFETFYRMLQSVFSFRQQPANQPNNSLKNRLYGCKVNEWSAFDTRLCCHLSSLFCCCFLPLESSFSVCLLQKFLSSVTWVDCEWSEEDALFLLSSDDILPFDCTGNILPTQQYGLCTEVFLDPANNILREAIEWQLSESKNPKAAYLLRYTYLSC